MTNLMKRAFVLGLTAALPTALVTASANAQEEEALPAEQEACTAELMPETIPVGLTAVAVEAIFSQDLGEIRDVKVDGGDSGLTLAEPDPMAEEEVAEEGVEAEAGAAEAGDAGELARPDHARTLWLNTETAVPGAYRVTLVGETGECTADLTVSESGLLPEEGGAQPEEGGMQPEDGGTPPDESGQ